MLSHQIYNADIWSLKRQSAIPHHHNAAVSLCRHCSLCVLYPHTTNYPSCCDPVLFCSMLAELGLMHKLHTSQVALLLKLGQKPTASIYRQNITGLPKRGPLLQPSYKKTTAESSRLLAVVWSDIILHTLPGPIHRHRVTVPYSPFPTGPYGVL